MIVTNGRSKFIEPTVQIGVDEWMYMKMAQLTEAVVWYVFFYY